MAVVSEGSIVDHPLSEVLWAIHWRKLTGCLTLQQPPHKKDLYFRAGLPFFARSTMKSETLGRFLLNRKVITPDAYERATLQSIQDNRKLGDALVKCGALSQEALESALMEQVRERFLAAFGLKQASFAFSDVMPLDVARERGSLDILAILRDGIARCHDFEFLTHALQGWSRGPVHRTAAYNVLVLSLPLDGSEARVAGAVDGRRGIGDLIASLAMDPHRLFPALYLLRSVGLLRGEGEPEPTIGLPSTRPTPESLDRKLADITSQGAPPPMWPAVPPAEAEPPRPAAIRAEEPEIVVPDAAAAPSLPPPKSADGRQTGAVPRTFAFVRHDEELAIDVSDVQSVAVPPQPGRDADGASRGLEDEITVVDPRSAPPKAPARSIVHGVIEAARTHSRGDAALASGDLAAALGHLEKASAMHPSDGDVMVSLACAYYVRDRISGPSGGVARALELLERALMEHPKQPRGHALRALCLRERGDVAGYNAAMQRATQLDRGMGGFEDKLMGPFKKAGGDDRGLFGKASSLFKKK